MFVFCMLAVTQHTNLVAFAIVLFAFIGSFLLLKTLLFLVSQMCHRQNGMRLPQLRQSLYLMSLILFITEAQGMPFRLRLDTVEVLAFACIVFQNWRAFGHWEKIWSMSSLSNPQKWHCCGHSSPIEWRKLLVGSLLWARSHKKLFIFLGVWSFHNPLKSSPPSIVVFWSGLLRRE